MMYDVCVLHEDEYVTLIPDNETIDNGISNFIKECMKRFSNPRELLSKTIYSIISHDNVEMASMLWAESFKHESPILIVLRRDRNTSYFYNMEGDLVKKKSV